jgi:hypothetical protein
MCLPKTARSSYAISTAPTSPAIVVSSTSSYESTRTDGRRFRSTEVLTFRGDKLGRAEVYFGWDLE